MQIGIKNLSRNRIQFFNIWLIPYLFFFLFVCCFLFVFKNKVALIAFSLVVFVVATPVPSYHDYNTPSYPEYKEKEHHHVSLHNCFFGSFSELNRINKIVLLRIPRLLRTTTSNMTPWTITQTSDMRKAAKEISPKEVTMLTYLTVVDST